MKREDWIRRFYPPVAVGASDGNTSFPTPAYMDDIMALLARITALEDRLAKLENAK